MLSYWSGEVNTLQRNRKQREMHNQPMSALNNNWGVGNNPYSNCCWGGGSSGGSEAGAAGMGEIGGMALGTAIGAATRPSTALLEENPPAYCYWRNSPPSYGYPPQPSASAYSLPAGAFLTTINGSTHYLNGSTHYEPFYSGSPVVYVASQP